MSIKIDRDITDFNVIDEIKTKIKLSDKFQQKCKLWDVSVDDFSIIWFDEDYQTTIKNVEAPEGERHSIMIKNNMIYGVCFEMGGDKQREARLKAIGKSKVA